jgi:hypothetical protein
LFVYDPNDPSYSWSWLALETIVTILEGPEAPELSVRLFQAMQGSPSPPGKIMWEGKEISTEEFLRIMLEEQRLIYEFDVTRTYGLY